MRYALDGDTMGNLVAVLNTNFWLATHVLTITIGYGCCLVAAIFGHIYLIERLRKKDSSHLSRLHKNMLGACLVALFFATLGTILGGIWADQSWGRFWGWDPKENGALLVCLWLIWLLHGKISGFLRPLFFASLTALTTIVIAFAWFGVNLLGVGLHSYGFTENIAFNLFLFTGIEMTFISMLLISNLYQQKTQVLTHDSKS
jgi:ABC-type transport system involved in cytochrome c biogenesis permease subunit